jgi:hypothetical protein
MSTGDLFDWAKRARASDPETSKEAAIETRVSVAIRRSQFLEGLTRCGGSATAREAASQIANGNIALHDSIRRRASDLARDGLIRETGSRVCAISGKRATVYEHGGTLGVQTPTTTTPGHVGSGAFLQQPTT